MTASPIVVSPVQYYERDVFGLPNLYVRDPKVAAAIADVLGTKTIQPYQMERLTTAFGLEWERVIAPSRA